MVVDVALYTVVHQPRRLKLPAQPIPRCASIEDLTRCLFDERLNERHFHRAAQACYYPAVHMFLDLVRRQGLHLALGISLSFVRQAILWDSALLKLFRELVAEENVELVCVESYRSLHGLIDPPSFAMRMRWMADEMEQVLGKRPTIADVSDLGISGSLYNALDTAGFQGILIESSPQIMQWRSSNYLYRSGNAEDVVTAEVGARAQVQPGESKGSQRDRQGPPYLADVVTETSPYLLARHANLSADVSERFADSTWPCYPLYAGSYADWIKHAGGDFVLLGWDFEIFGERYAQASGIFEFMQSLPAELERREITTRTPGELIDRFARERSYTLPLPVHPATWAAAADPGSYFDHRPQQVLFQLMADVYNLARLTEHPDLFDLAIWLMQADNLRLIHWPDYQFASSVVPYEWWRLGPSGLLREQRQVYINMLSALEPYLPVRLHRQTSRPTSCLTEASADGRALKERGRGQAEKERREPKKSRPSKEAKEVQKGKSVRDGRSTTRRNDSARTGVDSIIIQP